MARTSNAPTTASAPRRRLDRLLSADEVAEFLGTPVATWAVLSLSHARTAATHYGAESRVASS
jgi:hypothetical protein